MRKLRGQKMHQATHKISAVYYPFDNTVELTGENIETGEVATLTTTVDAATGEKIAEVVTPCGYNYATNREAKDGNTETVV